MTQGYDSKAKSKVERANRKAREYQRAFLLDAVGRRKLYSELGAEAMIHGMYCDNFRPEAGQESPYVKVGNIEVELEEVTHIFGSEAWVREEEERRSGKMDTPNRQAIYLGESELVQYGKKVAFIDYDEKKEVWIISPAVHRHSKNVQVMNGNMILKSKAHTPATALDIERHLDKVSGKEAPVYEVEKIHDKRFVSGEIEYRCSWKGYAKSHKTWEPKANLTEYGA